VTGKWSPNQYLKCEDHRTRPARDLLVAVPNALASRAVDLGCGPGNSTELLKDRFPDAEICGVDSSPEMIEAARKRLPDIRFEVADIADWRSPNQFDVVFANAVLQWLPDHRGLFPRLASTIGSNGTLAVQVPDNLDEPSHAAMRAAADYGRWKAKLGAASGERTDIMTPAEYYSVLRQDRLQSSAGRHRRHSRMVQEHRAQTLSV